MSTNSKWMPTTVAFVVMALVTTTILEPVAFGKDPEDTKQVEKAAEKAPSPLPSRPEFMVAQATLPQTQTRAVPSTPPQPPKPSAQQSVSKSKKWIWIVVGAGAAGATAFALRGGGTTPPPAPTIVVGAPVVGQPQ